MIRSLGLNRGDEALLPAYTCAEVVQPFEQNGLDVRYYKTGRDLQIDAGDLAVRLSPRTRLFLFIHYFGFPLERPKSVFEKIEPRRIIVEDSTHSVLSTFAAAQHWGDIEFASLGKTLPLPDGAAISWGDGRLADFEATPTRLSAQYVGAVSCGYAGALLKGLWLQRPGMFPKRAFRQLQFWSEGLRDGYPKPAAISPFSKFLLSRLDLMEFAEIRRRNYQILANGIEITKSLRPLYDTLPNGVCPLGMPVLADERDELRRFLAQEEVYAAIHWQLPDSVDRDEFADAWWVSDRILTIPVDQRYDERDMARVLSLLNRFARGEG